MNEILATQNPLPIAHWGHTLVLIHIAVTWAMVGIIWVIQLVHYPIFDRVDKLAYSEFQSFHMRRISYVVMPLMMIELLTAAVLWVVPVENLSQTALILGALLLTILWLSTFTLQVPEHHRLEKSFDGTAHRRLVLGNWIRTIAWTLRGVTVLALLAN